MKVMVLGSTGFIGKAIVDLFKQESYDVKSLERRECDFLNVRELTALIKKNKPNLVLNAAGKVAGIQGNIETPYDLIHSNASLSLSISKACLDAGVENYISYSAACIYPSVADHALGVSDLWDGKPEKTSINYATAKLLNLQITESINSQFSLNWKTIIPSNLYGPKIGLAKVDNSKHVLESLIAKFCAVKMLNEEQIVLWGDGTPKRTFLHVKDLATATLCVSRNLSATSSAINVNGNLEIEIRDLAKKIAEYCKYEGNIVFDNNMPNGAMRKNLDDSELRNLGWNPKIQFESELQLMIDSAFIEARSLLDF